jgi:hypothetical protein
MTGVFADGMCVAGGGHLVPLFTRTFEMSSLRLSQILMCIYLRCKSTVDKADGLLSRNFIESDSFRLYNVK